MENQNLTRTVKNLAGSKGIDLLGFAPVERFKHSPRMLHPNSHLPEAKTVISIAMHYGHAPIEMAGKSEAETLNPLTCSDFVLNDRLMGTAYDIARLLEKEGYPSLAFLPTMMWRVRPYKDVDTTHTADISHRHVAVAAGLGEFGMNGLTLTPEFGPRQRFNTIITTAPLETTPLYSGPALCDGCMICFRECHSKCLGALMNEKIKIQIGDRNFTYLKTDKWRCSWVEQFRLSGNAGAKHYGMNPDMPVPDEVSDSSPEKAEKTVSEALKKWDSVQRYVGVATIGSCLQECTPPCIQKKS